MEGQGRRNSIDDALELRLSCTNPATSCLFRISCQPYISGWHMTCRWLWFHSYGTNITAKQSRVFVRECALSSDDCCFPLFDISLYTNLSYTLGKKGCSTPKLWYFWHVSHQSLITGASPRQSCAELLVSRCILPAFEFNVYFQTIWEQFWILAKMKFHLIRRFELSSIGQNVHNHAEISRVESLITDFHGQLVSDACYCP